MVDRSGKSRKTKKKNSNQQKKTMKTKTITKTTISTTTSAGTPRKKQIPSSNLKTTNRGRGLIVAACASIFALSGLETDAANIIVDPGFDYSVGLVTPPVHNDFAHYWPADAGAAARIAANNQYKPASDPDPALSLRDGNSANQDLSYTWSATETFTLGIIGANHTWAPSNAKFKVQLREADGTVLWDSGELDVSGTATTSAYTGTGHIFNWDIDASTFGGISGALEGSPLNIQLVSEAGYIFVDDVSLTAVPEPSTTALLGLGALALILRRRK